MTGTNGGGAGFDEMTDLSKLSPGLTRQGAIVLPGAGHFPTRGAPTDAAKRLAQHFSVSSMGKNS